MHESILTWLTGIKQENCSGNAYISYHDDDGDECVIADLNDVRTALELGNKKFEIKVNASAARAAEHAGAAAAAATTTASVGDKTTDPTKLDQAVEKFLQQQLDRQMANKFHKKGTVLKINNTLTPTQTHAFNMYQHQQSRL